MPAKIQDQDFPAIFWNKIDIKDDDSCWEWNRHRDSLGYGQTRFHRKMERTHRVAWTLLYGEIPKGILVLHKCDNPPCCNPHHLFLGTDKDNSEDREKKGRGNRRYLQGVNHPHHGTNHKSAKLDEQKVLEIRKLFSNGVSSYQLAEMFGVSPATAWSAAVGKSWSWL